MADYTHFRFSDLGERAITKVDGVIAQTGIWYAEGSVITSEKQNANDYGEPYDQIKYEAKNASLTSNEASIFIDFPPNKTITPESQDVVLSASNNTSIDLINHIPYNNAVDRVKIISFTNEVGELEFFGSLVFPNKVVMQYDLSELKFNTLTGNGNPYQKIYYQVGNADGYNSTIYSITININGQASLINLFQNEDEVSDNGVGYKFIEATLKIENGYVNGIAKLDLDVQLSANAWPTTTQNQIIIGYTGGSEDINQNGIVSLDIPLGPNGEAQITFQLGISLADLPVTGTIDFNLININGDANLVSSTNQETINVNF